MALGPGVPDPPLANLDHPRPNSRHRRGESYAVHTNPILGGHPTLMTIDPNNRSALCGPEPLPKRSCLTARGRVVGLCGSYMFVATLRML
jgi:hypothetical protein